MAGIDFITIMNMAVWKSLRMVQRYASVGVDHTRANLTGATGIADPFQAQIPVLTIAPSRVG